MAIGQRIKYFRNRKGMTQKQLGEQLGFMGKTSDVRMAQYESEARVPKIDLERHCFFTEQLIAAGVDPEIAEADACRMEHVISSESFEKMKAAVKK